MAGDGNTGGKYVGHVIPIPLCTQNAMCNGLYVSSTTWQIECLLIKSSLEFIANFRVKNNWINTAQLYKI